MDYQPQGESGAGMCSAPPKSGMGKGALAGIAGILIAAAVGAAAWAYTSYYAPAPEPLVENMIARSQKIKTAEFDGEVVVDVTTNRAPKNPFALGAAAERPIGEPRTYRFSVRLAGASDVTDRNNPKATATFTIGGNLLEEAGLSSVITAEYRLVNKIFYLKFGKLPSFGFFDPNLLLKDRWLKVDIAELAKTFGPPDAADRLEAFSARPSAKLTDEQVRQVQNLLRQTPPVSYRKRGSGQVEGVRVYRYEFTLNKEALPQFVAEFAKIAGAPAMTAAERGELADDLKKIGSITGELWLGKKDALVYKLALSVPLPKNEKITGGGLFSLTLFIKNYDEPVTVEAPADAKPVDQLLGELMLGAGGAMAPGAPLGEVIGDTKAPRR